MSDPVYISRAELARAAEQVMVIIRRAATDEAGLRVVVDFPTTEAPPLMQWGEATDICPLPQFYDGQAIFAAVLDAFKALTGREWQVRE